MKTKVLAILGLATILSVGACRSGTNTVVTNTTTTNTNMAMATPMSTPMSTPMATADTATQKTVEDALKKAGLNDVMVSATTAEVTLRGSVAKGKMADAVRIATEAGRKKVNNQLTEK